MRFDDRRILVVEDEYFIAQDIVEALGRLGAIIEGPAGSIPEALQLLDGGDGIDLAILDINLRGTMSFPLAEKLRADGVPFLFVTGYEAAIIPPELSDASVWKKPFDTGDLVVAAAAALMPSPSAPPA